MYKPLKCYHVHASKYANHVVYIYTCIITVYVFVLVLFAICTHLTEKEWILLGSSLHTMPNISCTILYSCSVFCKLSFRSRSSWHFISRHQWPHKVFFFWIPFIKSLNKNIHDSMCTEETFSSILQLQQRILAFPPSTENVWRQLIEFNIFVFMLPYFTCSV